MGRTGTAALKIGAQAPVAAVRGMARRDLTEQWKRLYGTPPPPNAARCLIELAVAYRLQSDTQGDLKSGPRRQLIHIAQGEESSPSLAARPGTILVREWHGVSYTVTVLDKGVMFDGRLYRSLTEVAEVITGNHWSGPVFFGLKKAKSTS
jgi:hypothetical protein